MEEFYNRLVEEYDGFPADAIDVLRIAAGPSAEVELALAKLSDWHERMKVIIESEAGVIGDEDDEDDEDEEEEDA